MLLFLLCSYSFPAGNQPTQRRMKLQLSQAENEELGENDNRKAGWEKKKKDIYGEQT